MFTDGDYYFHWKIDGYETMIIIMIIIMMTANFFQGYSSCGIFGASAVL
jgi:hypothetical protein